MNDQMIDTWRINNRINLYLLDALTEESLAAQQGKGRNVGKVFAHIHNVRLMWIEVAAKDLMEGLKKFAAEEPVTISMLKEALQQSGEAMVQLLERSIEAGKVKNFKPHPTAFFGYILAHEGHHRGQIMLILKTAGMPVDKKITYGMWEWGVR